MIFLWLLIKGFERKNQVELKRDETKEIKIETLQKIPENVVFNNWIYKICPHRVKRDDTIVDGDDVYESDPNDEMELSKNTEHFDDFAESLKKKINRITNEILASSFASIFSTVLSHPFVVIKEEIQSHRYPRQRHHARYIRPPIIYVIRDIFIAGGLKRFYRDHLTSQCNSLVQTISMFWTYQQVYEYLIEFEELKNCTSLVSFTSGFISATIPVITLYPLERLQKRNRIKRKIFRMYGPIGVRGFTHNMNYIRGLFRGCSSLYLHVGILYGLRFLFYNKIRDEILLQQSRKDVAFSTDLKFSENDQIHRISNCILLLAGGIAAVLGDLIAYPFEVIHARIKMSSLKRQQLLFKQNCFRIGQCFKTILKNESILTFYSGIFPTMLSSMVNTAVQFAVHEKAINSLSRLFPA